MAVCPAGEDVIGPYLQDKQRHLQEVVRPLQERAEPVYVVPGSDAEAVARRKFKNKTVKPVGNGLRPRSIAGLLTLMPMSSSQTNLVASTRPSTSRFTGAEAARSDDQDPKSNARNQGGPRRQAGRPCHRGRENLARFSCEGAESDCGTDPKKDPLEGQPKAAACLRQMLSRRGSAARSTSRYIPQALGASIRSCALPERTIRLPERSDGSANSSSRKSKTSLTTSRRFASGRGRRRNPFRLPARTVPDAAYCAARHPDKALLHDRVLTHLARP